MLAIRRIGYAYPAAEEPALADVSFDAARGQILGLLGPNGAGKTTLLAQLAGLLPIQHGEISLDGEAIAALRARAPTRIALAPQEFAFYARLTVSENLDCFAGVCGLRGREKKTRIAECIAFAQLGRFANRLAERLSGGLKRRLNLAIALLADPELLLLDEPTVGVDPQSRAFILESVRSLAAEGRVVIYTSHYMEEVESIADRVVILDLGRVVRQGTLDELLDIHGNQLAVTVEQGSLERLQTLLAAFGEVTRRGDSVIVSLPARDSLAAALAAVAQDGMEISHARFGQDNLESVFMTLTQRSLRD